MIGNNSLLRCAIVVALAISAQVASFRTAAAEIAWQRDPAVVLQSAQQTRKPIVVFVTARWCHYCQKMKHETWSNPGVTGSVSQTFHTLMLDADRDQAIVAQFGLQGYPATLVYAPDGRWIAQRQGFLTPDELVAWLQSTTR